MSSQLRMQMLEGRSWGAKEDAEEPMGRPRGLSSKILGLGVALVGVLILAVALIMGLEFPKYVHHRLSARQCVIYQDHEDFSGWVAGSWWNKVVRLYFWEITNPREFLYEGQLPVVRERGPYVYQVTEQKRDVFFDYDHVTFVTSRQYQFLSEETTAECQTLGRRCLEDDQITVLNSGYLRETTRAGGEIPLLMTWVPPTVTKFLEAQGIRPDANGTWGTGLEALGCLDVACLQRWNSSLDANATAVDFGQWLRLNDSEAKAAVLDHHSSGSFSHQDMSRLFDALTNDSLWRGHVLLKDNAHLLAECQNSSLSSSLCGLASVLSLSSNFEQAVTWSALKTWMCADAEPCLGLSSSADDAVISAHVQVMRDFVLRHLLEHVQDTVFRGGNRDLLTTRAQSELARGYRVGRAAGGEVDVGGALSSLWETGQQDANVSWRLATCLEDRNLNNNMVVKEYHGASMPPRSLLRPGVTPPSLVAFSDFLPACASLYTCVACGTPPQTARVFVSELWRAVNFTGLTSTEYGGAHLYRLYMHNNTLADDAAYDVSGGAQTVTGVVGTLAWRSYPRTAGSSSFPQTPSDSRKSYIDVEPSSGRVWRRRIQLQMNLGIRAEDVNGPRLTPLNVSQLLQPVPVWWTDRETVITWSEVNLFYYKVTRLLAVSCGGLCALSVISLVILVISVVVCASPGKPNRVAPAVEEISMATHH